MTKLSINFILLLAGLLVVSMLAGCSDSDVYDQVPPFLSVISIIPPSGTAISANETITVNFERKPADVTVIPGTFRVTGKTVIITGPFAPGELRLIITCADGTLRLNYTVTEPGRGNRKHRTSHPRWDD